MAANSHRREYLIIFIWLAVLTAIEVGVAGMPIPKTPMVAALVGLALVKATLVAAFFMHLKSETKILRGAVAGMLTIPMIYALVLITEAAWRMV